MVVANGLQHIIELFGLIHIPFQILYLTRFGIFAQQTLFFQKIIHRIEDEKNIVFGKRSAVLRRDGMVDELDEFTLFRF